MPRQAAWLVTAALLAAGSCGCTSARYVTLEPNGGVVAIPDNSNSWPTHNRDKAEALMRQKCPQGYVIEREGEVVTGTTEHTETHTARSGDPILATPRVARVDETVSQDTTHHDKTEWRIWFRAKDAPPAPGPAAPPVVVPASYRPSASLPAQPVPVAVGGDGR
jgi:hypothetical protein